MSPGAITLLVVGVLAFAAVVYFAWRLISNYSGELQLNRGNVTTVPQLVDLSIEDARTALRQAHLKPATPNYDYHESIQKDRVYRQDPAAGERVRPGKEVKLYVSMGPAKFIVPELAGVSLKDVPGKLAKAGLVLGAVTKLYYPDAAEGQVLNQNPLAGTEFSSSAAVDVYVAAHGGLPKINMPALSGLSLADAETMLSAPDMNLHLGLVEYVANDAVAPGTVVAQSIEAGKSVELGSRVELQVGIPTLQKLAPTHTLTINLSVPLGPPSQSVKIKVYDKLGEKVDYENEHKPGDIISRSIDLEGEAKVLIFIGSLKTPYREERL